MRLLQRLLATAMANRLCVYHHQLQLCHHPDPVVNQQHTIAAEASEGSEVKAAYTCCEHWGDMRRNSMLPGIGAAAGLHAGRIHCAASSGTLEQKVLRDGPGAAPGTACWSERWPP